MKIKSYIMVLIMLNILVVMLLMLNMLVVMLIMLNILVVMLIIMMVGTRGNTARLNVIGGDTTLKLRRFVKRWHKAVAIPINQT